MCHQAERPKESELLTLEELLERESAALGSPMPRDEVKARI
jgi:hypothetical protein